MKEQIEKQLAGRRALVTGASSGIGRATVRALVAAGAHVIASARREDRLNELVAELGPQVEALALDVTDHEAVQSELGSRRLDLVLANAGLGRGVDPLQTGDIEGWHEMIDTNIKGVLHVVRATLPGMLERTTGDMVLIGSVAGREVYPGGNVYCATKHAVKALYNGLRLDAGGKNVRFTTVDPGLVETEFSDVRFRGDTARARTVYQGYRPLRPEDVADAILYAVTRPAHVNVGEIVLWPTDQSSTTTVHKQT